MQSRKRKAVRIRPKTAAARSATQAVVFTSVDGALLDGRTFEPGPARETIARLRDSGVPVVPVTVMTLKEIAPIAVALGLRTAMIIEAGAAIARWSEGGWQAEPCGPPAETFLDVIGDIERASGASLLVYSAMSEAEAALVSGRSGQMLRASMHRQFSEPFLIESGDLDAVKRAAADIGFSIRRGRRFLHLCRECDEGEAFQRLREELRCDVAIAAGAAAVDAEFLALADVAILIPALDGDVDPELRAALPNARIAPLPGPEGWAAAVMEAVSDARGQAGTAGCRNTVRVG